jgi:hypothetical protein
VTQPPTLDGQKRRGEASSTVCLSYVPLTKPRVPHISLVFREMWDTTVLHVQFCRLSRLHPFQENEKRRGPASLSMEPSPLPCHPDRSEAQRRDLRLREPFVEMFFDRAERSAVSRNPSLVPQAPSGLVSGHGFSRAIKAANDEGFSPCGNPVLSEGYGLQAVHNCCVMNPALAAEGCNSFAITLFAQTRIPATRTFARKVN